MTINTRLPVSARHCAASLIACHTPRPPALAAPFVPTHRRVTLAVPTSPEVENLMPSFVAEMSTVSPMLVRSRTMRWYSEDGILISAEYSWSGMPRCSDSMDMSFRSKSEMRSWFEDSNMSVSWSALSSAFSVMVSSLPASRNFVRYFHTPIKRAGRRGTYLRT